MLKISNVKNIVKIILKCLLKYNDMSNKFNVHKIHTNVNTLYMKGENNYVNFKNHEFKLFYRH